MKNLILSLLILIALTIPFKVVYGNVQLNISDLIKRANDAYSQKRYAEAAQLYSAAIDKGDNDQETFYNAACCYALAGDKNRAFSYLESAILNNFQDVEHLKEDTDLESLHSDTRWHTIVEKCKANYEKYIREAGLWNNAPLQTPYQMNLSDEEKVAGLSMLWAEVKYNFAYFDKIPNLDWNKLYITYLAKVRQTNSTLEYYKLLKEMCAQLKDGHTRVTFPTELKDRYFYLPIETALIQDKVFILYVHSDSLKQDGIQKGLEIISIDGIPVKQYAEQQIAPYVSSSTKHGLDNLVYSLYLLSGEKGKHVELELRDDRGNLIKRKVQRTDYKDAKYPKMRPPFEFQVLEGNIGYVALNSFDQEDVTKAFDEAFEQIAQTDALILDLRWNGGGSTSIGWNILGYLTDKPFKTFKARTRLYRPYYRASRRGAAIEWQDFPLTDWPPNGKKYYAKPVVVLTSANTASAAEDFCVVFDWIKRGKMIGEPTFGSTGQPLVCKLPGGGEAYICTLGCSYPDGKEFVGGGIKPDILISRIVKDVLSGRDTVLEAAIDYLKNAAIK